MLFFCGWASLGSSCGVGFMGFLPGVLESGGIGFVGGCVGGVMDPGVPGGGDEGCVFGFFAVDDPAAGFLLGIFGRFFVFEVSIIERVASD